MTKPNWFLAWPIEAGPWLRDRVHSPPKGVRLFAPEDVHITLAFLGPVGEERARAALGTVAPSSAAPVDIGLGPVLPFGPPRRFSALSAEVAEGREALIARMKASQGPALEAAGARPERHAPRPHMTVARVGRRASKDERRAALRWAKEIDLSEVPLRLDRLALYTWSEDRSQRQFRIVEALRG